MIADTHVLPDRFTIEERLGEGLVAVTYRAHDAVLGRSVTVKVLRRQLEDDDTTARRFEREARAAAAVDHPNVVDIYDYGTHEGTFYLVLQYVPGWSLRQILTDDGPLTPPRAVGFTRQVLAGLGAIHAAGLVHRDVKPHNVIVNHHGMAALTDFGIAVAASDIRLTTQDSVWGTPAYMAPEQARGEAVSPATDLYAVGAMLFELLTGRPPFSGEHPVAVVLAHLHNTPPSPRDLAPAADISPALEDVILQALAKSPADRFESAVAMSTALESSVSGASTSPAMARTSLPAANDAPLRATARHEHPTVQIPASAPVGRPRRRRWRPEERVALLVLALLLVIAVGSRAVLGSWTGGGDGSATATPSSKRIVAALTSKTPVPTATSPARPTSTPLPTATQPSEVQIVIQPTAPPSETPAPTSAPSPTFEPTSEPETPEPTDEPAATESPPIATDEPVEAEAASGPTIAPAGVDAASLDAPFAFEWNATDWTGAYVGDQSWYGRPWVALYGSRSAYPRASFTFALDAPPTQDSTLSIDGLDDEWSGSVPIALSVNGNTVYAGPSPFESWDGAGQGENAAWTTATFTIPASALNAGINQIDVANTAPDANFGSGPYVLIGSCRLDTGG